MTQDITEFSNILILYVVARELGPNFISVV
jgi:hypothetical protein